MSNHREPDGMIDPVDRDDPVDPVELTEHEQRLYRALRQEFASNPGDEDRTVHMLRSNGFLRGASTTEPISEAELHARRRSVRRWPLVATSGIAAALVLALLSRAGIFGIGGTRNAHSDSSRIASNSHSQSLQQSARPDSFPAMTGSASLSYIVWY